MHTLTFVFLQQLVLSVVFLFLSSQETEHVVKKHEDSKEEHCVNPGVFQEYITGARLGNWQAYYYCSVLGSLLFQLYMLLSKP